MEQLLLPSQLNRNQRRREGRRRARRERGRAHHREDRIRQRRLIVAEGVTEQRAEQPAGHRAEHEDGHEAARRHRDHNGEEQQQRLHHRVQCKPHLGRARHTTVACGRAFPKQRGERRIAHRPAAAVCRPAGRRRARFRARRRTRRGAGMAARGVGAAEEWAAGEEPIEHLNRIRLGVWDDELACGGGDADGEGGEHARRDGAQQPALAQRLGDQ